MTPIDAAHHTMTHESGTTVALLTSALSAPAPQARLRAALAAGTEPSPGLVGPLVARCAVEPDFYVRDMLTWALTRQDAGRTVPALLAELGSDTPQARSQALHTLSKIGDPGTWGSLTPAMLHDADVEVARSAWRAAVVLVPPGERVALAAELAQEFGRGTRDVQLSLSRAFVALGDAAADAVEAAQGSPDPEVRAHADATAWLVRDPEGGFAIEEAKRALNLKDAPL